jgi:hypothetical protein
MESAGITMEDIMAVRGPLRSGAVTIEDVRTAARRKGVEPPAMRLSRSWVRPKAGTEQQGPNLPSLYGAAVATPTTEPDLDNPFFQSTPAPKAETLKKGRKTAAPKETKPGAPKGRKDKQGGVGKRKATDEGGATPEAGGGNRTEQGGKKQAAAPKPLKTPAAKSSAETLTDEGITLTKGQAGALNVADEQIKRYRAFLECLGRK